MASPLSEILSNDWVYGHWMLYIFRHVDAMSFGCYSTCELGLDIRFVIIVVTCIYLNIPYHFPCVINSGITLLYFLLLYCNLGSLTYSLSTSDIEIMRVQSLNGCYAIESILYEPGPLGTLNAAKVFWYYTKRNILNNSVSPH